MQRSHSFRLPESVLATLDEVSIETVLTRSGGVREFDPGEVVMAVRMASTKCAPACLEEVLHKIGEALGSQGAVTQEETITDLVMEVMYQCKDLGGFSILPWFRFGLGHWSHDPRKMEYLFRETCRNLAPARATPMALKVRTEKGLSLGTQGDQYLGALKTGTRLTDLVQYVKKKRSRTKFQEFVPRAKLFNGIEKAIIEAKYPEYTDTKSIIRYCAEALIVDVEKDRRECPGEPGSFFIEARMLGDSVLRSLKERAPLAAAGFASVFLADKPNQLAKFLGELLGPTLEEVSARVTSVNGRPGRLSYVKPEHPVGSDHFVYPVVSKKIEATEGLCHCCDVLGVHVEFLPGFLRNWGHNTLGCLVVNPLAILRMAGFFSSRRLAAPPLFVPPSGRQSWIEVSELDSPDSLASLVHGLHPEPLYKLPLERGEHVALTWSAVQLRKGPQRIDEVVAESLAFLSPCKRYIYLLSDLFRESFVCLLRPHEELEAEFMGCPDCSAALVGWTDAASSYTAVTSAVVEAVLAAMIDVAKVTDAKDEANPRIILPGRTYMLNMPTHGNARVVRYK